MAQSRPSTTPRPYGPNDRKEFYVCCTCHQDHMGHEFYEELRCKRCGKDWHVHQVEPSRCPRPLTNPKNQVK